MLKLNYFLADIFILSAEKQPIKLSWRKIEWLLLGAGYEAYIMAFFIGLYFDKSIPLEGETKKFGWAIRNWGNVDARKGRRNYHEITKFMFVALVARADIDFIALDKGEITVRKAVDILIQKMEEYANYGFYYMLKEKLEINPNYFYRNSAFLDIFTSLIKEEPNKIGRASCRERV